MKFLTIVSFGIFILGCRSEVVEFSEIALNSEDDIPDDYTDNKQTGSYLFNIVNELEKDEKISLNIKIRDLMMSGLSYFRTHPKFVLCLQKIITNAHNNNPDLQVTITSAFKPNSAIGSSSSMQDLYAAAGTGAVLSITHRTTGAAADLTKIAQAALKFCPTIFAGSRQHVGIIMQSDSVHVHMTGYADTQGHQLGVDGHSGMTEGDFHDWAMTILDNALDPVVAADCSAFSPLANGGVYPESVTSAEEAVGSADSDIQNEIDYRNRLVTYPGGNENVICNEDCAMAPRMFEVIRKLQHFARTKMYDKLEVVKLFAPEEGSLHLEGRQANVRLVSSNIPSRFETLSKFAQCAGADFVGNQETYITIAVKKQNSIDVKKTKFPQGELIHVSPVEAEMGMLQSLDANEYPVFDGEFQGSKYIGEYSQVNQYMSSSTRYFRLDPAIARCYDKIVRYEKKWNNDELVNIPILKAFQTHDEILAEFDPSVDHRSDAFLRGQALVIQYDTSLDQEYYNIHRLVRTVVHMCGPVFDDVESSVNSIGIGIYEDGLYIDMREEFEIWMNGSLILPDDASEEEYSYNLKVLYENAKKGYVVDPEKPTRACLQDDVPRKRSLDYQYVHPEHIQQKRRKRSTNEEEESCLVQQDTPFCERSKFQRDSEIAYIWDQIKRKHIKDMAFESELRTALLGCFGTCGTCLSGEVYEEKLMHCNNLLHWVSFELNNDDADVSNFYHLKNFDTRKMACEGLGEDGKSRHCLSLAPLYAIFASSVYDIYRPDPTRSITEELYGAQDNPSIIPVILYQLYAIHANGTITVWVENAEEILFLRNPLKVAMLYNKAVTHIKVMVNDADAKDDVGVALEDMITDWVTSGCPTNSRMYIAPYTLHQVPNGAIGKRDTGQLQDFSFGERKLLERRNFEHIWMKKVKR